MKQKTISIFAAIGAQNLGDELILKNEIKLLKEEFGENTKFIVFSYDKKDIFFSDKNIKYKWYFPINIRKKRNIFKNIKNFFAFVFSIIKSDFIVIGGGGIFFDKEIGNVNPLKLWLFRARFFRFFRKKIYFFRVGIDIKNEANLKILKKIFKKAYKITVRDENSKNILDFIGIVSQIEKDPVFMDAGEQKFEKDFCIKKIKSFDFNVSVLKNLDFDFSAKTVGIAFRRGYLVQKSNISERMEEGIIREIINFLKQKNAKIILLPHSFHKTNKLANDEEFLKQFSDKNVKIASNMIEVYETYKNKKLDLCLSMRLHSMILCQVYEIPYVGVSYSLKTELALKTIFS